MCLINTRREQNTLYSKLAQGSCEGDIRFGQNTLPLCAVSFPLHSSLYIQSLLAVAGNCEGRDKCNVTQKHITGNENALRVHNLIYKCPL